MLGLVTRLLGGAITPLIDQLSASSARLLRKLALFLVAGLCLVVVLIALTMAFDLWVASMAGAIAGALAVAGLYFLIAVVAVALALRKPRSRRAQEETRQGTRQEAPDQKAAEAAASGLNAQIDAFIAPLLGILQNLGLRREQLAVLGGASIAKQIGPVPLVGLAILAGFLVGRMWGGWRAIFSSDLFTTLFSADVLSMLFGATRESSNDEDDPESENRA